MKWARIEVQGRPLRVTAEGDTLVGEDGTRHPLAGARFLPPVVPPNFYAAGLNFRAHIEWANQHHGGSYKVPTQADIGYRSGNALVGRGADIVIPADSTCRRRCCRKWCRAMRIVDLHCYPGTPEWIACQGPYVEALAKYWNRQWVGKSENEVLKDFTDAGVEAVLVALDLETTIATPPVTNEYAHAMSKRHPKRIIQAWGAVEPAKGEIAIQQVRKAVRELGLIGFHFHPIMQHFAVDDRRYYPVFEEIASLGAAVMIDVGTTGMGAGLPGGMGAVIRHAHPASIDRLAADFPNLKIIMAHPGWPWVDETTAVALHKGNVYWEMSGWAPKYFPGNLKVDMRSRLQDKIMFGSDYPSMPGTTGAVPAVANAVIDALRPLGIHSLDFPFSPHRVWAAITAANAGRGALRQGILAVSFAARL